MRTSRPLPFLAAAFVCLAALPGSARAQEPAYTITLPAPATTPDAQKTRLRATLEAASSPGQGRIFRVTAVPALPGNKNPMKIELTHQADTDGNLQYALSHLRIAQGVEALLEATTRTGGLMVGIPAQEGSFAVGAPVLTPINLIAEAGRRYDWKKKGEQRFVLLNDVMGDTILPLNATLTADGTEKLTLEQGEITVRRLKLKVEIPLLPKELQTAGTLLVGPKNAVLKADLPLLGPFLEMKGDGEKDADGSFLLRTAKPSGIVIRRRMVSGQRGGGKSGSYVTTLETAGGLVVASVNTDAAFRPVGASNMVRGGRQFSATITPTQVRWKLAAGTPQAVEVKGQPWLLTHFLATDLWEAGGGVGAALAVGEKREDTLLPLTEGQTTARPFTRERLPDITLSGAGNSSGGNITLRHYRLTFPDRVLDLWTDGRRLAKLASSDGFTVARIGWESATELLKAPAAPVPTPASPPSAAK